MKHFLLVALLVASSFYAQSQTKGTNAVGFGIWTSSNESNQGKQSGSGYSLTYGRFIRENFKLSLTGTYGQSKNVDTYWDNYSTSSSKGYGVSVNGQKYFPIVKKLFVYGGGGLEYYHTKTDAWPAADSKSNQYSLKGAGGVSYFVSKRFAFEVNLINANVSYYSSKGIGESSSHEQKNFNLSTSGNLSNLAFQIYFLF